jgi:hypothetical protein
VTDGATRRQGTCTTPTGTCTITEGFVACVVAVALACLRAWTRPRRGVSRGGGRPPCAAPCAPRAEGPGRRSRRWR